MTSEFRDFIQRIEYNSSIAEDNKRELISFLLSRLFSYVKVYNFEEYSILEDLLKKLDYDLYSFEKILQISYSVRNSIGSKNDNINIPKINYVAAIYKMFKEFDMDMWSYDNDYGLANMALARGAYNIIFDNEIINDEISFIELTKEIKNRYYRDRDTNRSACKILKYLHWIRKGLEEMEGKYNNVLTSEEFYSMFELTDDIDDLHFNELIKEFYPRFKNELFVLIKKAVDNSPQDRPSTDYVFAYLNKISQRREQLEKLKDKVIEETDKIDVDTKITVEGTFSSFISSLQNNRNININVSKSIINNIQNVFDSKRAIQKEFLSNEFDNLLNNCSLFVNDLVIFGSSSKSGVDELIEILVNNCKDFFVEYDFKTFKEIVEYILENTDISVEELKGIGIKCSQFFKEADVNKLKIINSTLRKFEKYLNDSFKNEDMVNIGVFENILINDPQLLLKNNKIEEIISFLKGDISLGNNGYHYPNFRIEKDFLSYNFYNKMKEDNYSILFEEGLGKFIRNLNYLEEICGDEIDFSSFNFNEDSLYAFLKHDLYNEGTNVIYDIRDLFNNSDYKKILESNCELLMMPSDDLEIIVKRCVLNENDDYNFYDLLSSELYFYRLKDFRGKSQDELIDKEFKYINLGINNSRKFDIEEITTSRYINSLQSDKIYDLYRKREKDKENLKLLLSVLESDEKIDLFALNNVVNRILNSYNALYGKVPCVSFKNSVIEVINDKKEKCEYKLSDINEELETKRTFKETYETEKKDIYFVVDQLNDVIRSLNSEVVKKDIEKFLLKFKEEHHVKNEQKGSDSLKSIKEIELKIEFLDREVEHFNYLLSIFDFKDLDIDYIYENEKIFSINTLKDIKMASSKNNEEKIEEILDGKNLVIFSNGVDLSEIPNDKNFIEKVYKFLGDGEFSITSKKFMDGNTLNAEFVEKYEPPRDRIWARRENRTPVRVYFIPIHTKYFTCYYITHVNYKDHSHLSAGCSSDEVYKRKIKEAEAFSRFINELNYDEIIKFINDNKKCYLEAMEPILTKMEVYNKKRNNKK